MQKKASFIKKINLKHFKLQTHYKEILAKI